MQILAIPFKENAFHLKDLGGIAVFLARLCIPAQLGFRITLLLQKQMTAKVVTLFMLVNSVALKPPDGSDENGNSSNQNHQPNQSPSVTDPVFKAICEDSKGKRVGIHKRQAGPCFFEVEISERSVLGQVRVCDVNGDTKQESVMFYHSAAVFTNDWGRGHLNWHNCSLKLLSKSPLGGITGAKARNGISGQPCMFDDDCRFDRHTKLKCYKPLCACQKARLQLVASKNNKCDHRIQFDYVGEFNANHNSLPQDIPLYEQEGKLFLVVPR